MAALAIDTFGEYGGINLRIAAPAERGWNFEVGVMTKEAFVRNAALRVPLLARVIAG
jgi:hypothetical protein